MFRSAALRLSVKPTFVQFKLAQKPINPLNENVFSCCPQAALKREKQETSVSWPKKVPMKFVTGLEPPSIHPQHTGDALPLLHVNVGPFVLVYMDI